MTTSTNSAMPRPWSWPYPGLGTAPAPSITLVSVGRPPPAQLMPMRISEMPMTVMMVPVTTGGKSGSSRLMNGATRMPNTPAAITAP